jgi:hypothetical protein
MLISSFAHALEKQACMSYDAKGILS